MLCTDDVNHRRCNSPLLLQVADALRLLRCLWLHKLVLDSASVSEDLLVPLNESGQNALDILIDQPENEDKFGRQGPG